jgi:hypothetical protein
MPVMDLWKEAGKRQFTEITGEANFGKGGFKESVGYYQPDGE